MKKRILSLLLTACLLAGLLPTVALAATQSNVTYLDENGISNVCASATVVDSATTTWNGGWYVVQGTVVISQGVTFSGDVYLILSDDCDLSVENGIAGQGNLTVYAQSTGGAQGRMSVVGSPVMEGDCSVSRGIRVNGSFTVNGGTVKVEGGESESDSIGIYVDEELIIDGGTVTAIGSDAENSTGIYVGYQFFTSGGTVTAIGGTADRSIGFLAGNENEPDNGGYMNISGTANVTAIGGKAASSIGINVCNEMIIDGGTVKAEGGDANDVSCGLFAYHVITMGGSLIAMGGNATDDRGSGSVGISAIRVTASGGDITAIGGTATSTTSVDESQSCGILVGEGGTTEGFGGYIDISDDAYVTAIGGTAAMMSCGIVVQICLTMTGGYLLAQASNNAKYYDSVYLGTLCLPGDSSYLWRSNAASTFADSTSDPYTDQQYNFLEIVCTYEEVTSKDTGWTTGLYVVNKNISIGSELFASINPVTVRVGGDVRLILAGGHKLTVHGRIEVNEGNSLTIYGQSSAGDKLVVNNSSGNAGIGGCNGCSSGSITINGGTVTATSEGDSAGIGGGGRGHGYVTINGGKVNASSTYGAGIGGGRYGIGYVTINGGTVIASSTYGAGIGGTTNSILSGNGDATIETSGIMGNTENFVGTINRITYYGIIVNGVQVTTVNKSNVLPNNQNGKVSYNADTNVLTIDGFLGDLLNPVTTVISGNGSTDIVLNGGGSFTAVGLTVTNAKNVTVTTNSTSPAILGDANITCSGDVSITNQNIAVYGTLTVKGAKNVTVTANGNVPVVFVDANISCSGEVQLVNNGGGKAIDGQLRIRKMDSLGYAIATEIGRASCRERV